MGYASMTITFASRTVRLGREYYVAAYVAGGARYRIGLFKFRIRADDWIAQHSTKWMPDMAESTNGVGAKMN
jgi:hypothetical protein